MAVPLYKNNKAPSSSNLSSVPLYSNLKKTGFAPLPTIRPIQPVQTQPKKSLVTDVKNKVVASIPPKEQREQVKKELREQGLVGQAKQAFANIFKGTENVARYIGKKAQQIPNPDLGTALSKVGYPGSPVGPVTGDLFKATNTEEKILNFISNVPSYTVQGSGKALETASTEKGRKIVVEYTLKIPQTMKEVKTAIDRGEWQKAGEIFLANPAIEFYLNATDFLGLAGLSKSLVKTSVKSLFKNKQTAQTLIKEALEEAEKPPVKVLPKEVKNGMQKVTTKTKVQEVQKPEVTKGEEPKVQASGQNKAVISNKVTQRKVSELVVHEKDLDPTQVSRYVEEIKAGGRPPLIVIKEGSKWGVDDGKNKLAAYKQLGITDVPTLEKVEMTGPKPQILPVKENIVKPAPKTSLVDPKDIKEPKSEPLLEEKVSGVAKQIEAKAVEKGMIDKGYSELAVYDSSTIKAQSKAASKYSIDDMNKIATGEKALPRELKPGTPLSIAEDYAIKNNDSELLRKLAKSPLATQVSESASELSLSRMRNTNSPVRLIKQVNDAREKAFKVKYKGKEVKQVVDETVKDIKKKVKAPDKYDWNKFLDTIKC